MTNLNHLKKLLEKDDWDALAIDDALNALPDLIRELEALREFVEEVKRMDDNVRAVLIEEEPSLVGVNFHDLRDAALERLEDKLKV